MTLALEPILFAIKINMRLVLGFLALLVAFRYYLTLRKKVTPSFCQRTVFRSVLVLSFEGLGLLALGSLWV